MGVDKLDINSLKSEFSKYKKDLLHLNEYMYRNPELGYQEVKSVDKITKLISKHIEGAKFKVTPSKVLPLLSLLSFSFI